MAHTLKALAFWMAAAALVAVSHAVLARRNTTLGTAATMASIVGAAWGYMRCADGPDAAHGLSVGAAWLSLSIIAELAVSAFTSHPCWALLGDPIRPLLRNVAMFVWVFAPALFARAELPRRELE